jgi:hypothetical protein
VSVPGATNPTIALTYTGYASIEYHVPSFRSHYFTHYGLATPSLVMPRSGTANYTGVVTGYGVASPEIGTSARTEYALTGTGTLLADFGTASLTSTMNITGAALDNSGNRDFGSFVHNGSIVQNTFSARGIVGSVSGTFYGPNADEFAGIFALTQSVPVGTGTDIQRIDLNGIFAGRRTGP